MPSLRAQSALEYLVTYGWAIFLVVLITALLWFLGAFDSVSLIGPGPASSGFTSFSYIDHFVNTSGAVILFANSVTREVVISKASVGKPDEFPDTDCSPGAPVGVGANGKFAIVCGVLPQGVEAELGYTYELGVTLNFTDSVSGGSHSDIGFVRGNVG